MSNQDSLPVKLKGVGDSLWVTFDATVPVEELKTALSRPFERLKQLAVNARVILDAGNDNADRLLIEELGGYLKEQYHVGVVSGPPEKPRPEVSNKRSEDLGSAWHAHRSDALIIAGRVRSGQKIQADKHLIILGDLNPGAEAFAGGDIIVLGTLMGTAVAGQPDNEGAIIMALDFRPTQVQIGGLAAAGTPEPGSKDHAPEFAKIENNKIVILDYIGENPFKRLAWPEVR
jgi:septum site-determining protein MinC